MASIHSGGKGRLLISDADGNMVDLSPYTNKVTLDGTLGEHSLWSYDLEVEGFWDPVVDAVLATWCYRQPRAFELEAKPTFYNGEALLATYGVSTPVSSVVTFSAEFAVVGAINRRPGPATDLSFSQLRETSLTRCLADYKHGLSEWSALEWAGAMCGEAGETANLAKKLRRGEYVPLEDIADEIADTVIYADLLAASLGITLGDAVVAKFNKTSRKIGSSEFLTDG